MTSKNILFDKLNNKDIKKSEHEWFNPIKISKYLSENGFQIIYVSAFNFYKNKKEDFKNQKTFSFMQNILNKNKTYFIAEAGVNHNGSFKEIKKLIINAKKCGADAVQVLNRRIFVDL